jgi:hypothetical protein
LMGCTSVKTHVNKGRISARSFSFLDTGSKPLPAYAEDRKEAHELVQTALKNNLAAKGVNYVAQGGDVTVAYLVVVGNNATTTSLNGYFGYTDDSEKLLQQVHKEQTSQSDDRGYFEAGTLVIDFLNPKTHELLQRRSIHAPVLRKLPMEKRAERVQSLIDGALKDVPLSAS